MATSKELNKIFLELSEPDEQEDVLIEQLHLLLGRITDLEKKIDDSSKESDESSKYLISEVREYLEDKTLAALSSLKDRTDGKIKSLKDTIHELSLNNDVFSIEIKDKLKDVWKEIKMISDNFTSVSDIQNKNKRELLELMSDFMSDRKKSDKSVMESISTVKEELKKDFLSKSRGGSMHRQISLNGTVIATRYADVNIIATGSSADNNTTKKTDITLTGGSGGSGYQAPLSGGLTGTNTWVTAPNVIVVDGIPMQQTRTDSTVNWTGTTTTVLTIAPSFDVFASA